MDENQSTAAEAAEPASGKRWKRAFWGLFLIALGVGFLFDRYGLADLPSIGRLWPAVFFVIGMGQLIEGRVGSFVTSVLMGVWFFACNEGWWDFTYMNSWGLILVAIGLGMVIRVLSGEDARRQRVQGGGVL
jgi:hypothetical protein